MKYKINGKEVTEEAFRASLDPSKLREMLEARTPPMSNTDREFLEGRGGCYDQFNGSYMGEFYRREAKLAGQDTTGKVYLSSLAAYPGDPLAWVSGRGDVQRVCEQRGWNCHGSVNVKSEPQQPEQIALAPDIVEREVQQIVAECPEPLKPREVADIREKVIENRTPHWAN